MSFSEDIQEQVERYLDGNMDVEEFKTFENLMSTNENLLEYIEVNKQMRLQYGEQGWASIEDSKENSKLNELESLFESNEVETSKRAIREAGEIYLKEEEIDEKKAIRSKFYYAIAVAASIALLISFFLNDGKKTNSEVYSLYDSWNELPSLIERGHSENEALVNGERAFERGDYKVAKEHLNEAISNMEDFNAHAVLYLGLSQLELNEYDEALSSFQKLIESNSIDASKGYWYKGLAYLKMDDKVNAVDLFEKIVANTANYNYEKAIEVLEKIK